MREIIRSDIYTHNRGLCGTRNNARYMGTSVVWQVPVRFEGSDSDEAVAFGFKTRAEAVLFATWLDEQCPSDLSNGIDYGDRWVARQTRAGNSTGSYDIGYIAEDSDPRTDASASDADDAAISKARDAE